MLVNQAIAWVIVGISLTLLVVLWHLVAYRELKTKWESLQGSIKQLEFMQDTLNSKMEMLQTIESRRILAAQFAFYEKQLHRYNALLQKPFYILPAKVLGFRAAQLQTKHFI